MTGCSEPAHPGRRVAVIVDGSALSATALRNAASQARQRNALLDVVSILPPGTDRQAQVAARVRLGEFTRRQCPYGVGVPVRLRVECGDPEDILPTIAEGAELLLAPPPVALATRISTGRPVPPASSATLGLRHWPDTLRWPWWPATAHDSIA
jgi:nucleotide-binding universal stress UspA family protein